MEWCITHHIRAQYIETTLRNIQSAQIQSRMSTKGISGFTNPFSSSFEDNELYFLSFGVPAEPDIAKELMRLVTLTGKLLQTSLTHF